MVRKSQPSGSEDDRQREYFLIQDHWSICQHSFEFLQKLTLDKLYIWNFAVLLPLFMR